MNPIFESNDESGSDIDQDDTTHPVPYTLDYLDAAIQFTIDNGMNYYGVFNSLKPEAEIDDNKKYLLVGIHDTTKKETTYYMFRTQSTVAKPIFDFTVSFHRLYLCPSYSDMMELLTYHCNQHRIHVNAYCE